MGADPHQIQAWSTTMCPALTLQWQRGWGWGKCHAQRHEGGGGLPLGYVSGRGCTPDKEYMMLPGLPYLLG